MKEDSAWDLLKGRKVPTFAVTLTGDGELDWAVLDNHRRRIGGTVPTIHHAFTAATRHGFQFNQEGVTK